MSHEEQHEEQRVIEAVRKHIQGRTPGGATLEVLSQGVRHDQDWWYVPIRPSVQPAKRYEYYETLAEVENELQKTEYLRSVASIRIRIMGRIQQKAPSLQTRLLT